MATHSSILAWRIPKDRGTWQATIHVETKGKGKGKSLSHVQLFLTPSTVAHQAPLSMGILQARILEWVAMPCSRESSQPRDQTQVSRTAGGFFPI